MNQSVFATLNGFVAAALRDPNPVLAPLSGNGDVAAALAALDEATTVIDTAPDLVAWFGALDAWGDAVGAVADAAFVPVEPLESLAVRVLQSRIPRLAALLSVAGVITSTPDGAHRFDTGRFFEFLTSADTVVNEAHWDALLGEAVPPGTGRLVAVLVGLVLLAPPTVAALVNGNLTIAPLAAPVAREPGMWADFRARTAQWLSVTLPLGDPSRPAPHPDDVLDLVSGIQADLTATIAGRSDRVAVPAGRRTDFELWLALSTAANIWEHDLGNEWRLRVEPGISVGFGRVEDGWHGAFRAFTNDSALLPGPGDPVRVTLGRGDQGPGAAPDILFGPPYDSRMSIRDVLLYLDVREEHPIAEIGLRLDGFAFVLTNRWFRAFGATDETFREGIRYTGDLSLAYVEGEGFRFGLDSSLDTLIVIPESIGRWGNKDVHLRWHSIRLQVPLEADAGEFRGRAEVRFHTSFQASQYVLLVLDGWGFWFGSWKDPLGDPNAERRPAGGLAPTGGGIQIEFKVASGGGYFSRVDLPDGGERWAGGLAVRVQQFGVVGFGIYERSGGGQKSFVVVLGVRFGPSGIQLGYGFALTGIGGMFGFDRRIDADALRERLTSGAAGNVLFLEDPIRNAPTIIGDLAAIMPAADGVYVVGPTAQITWIGFARIDLGLVFEFTTSALNKILLMGSFQAEAEGREKDKPLLRLRCDFLGLLDFERKELSVDATLINSQALETFALTGDLHFHWHWGGDNPYAIFSVGGFHPDFDPSPIVVPELTRVALSQVPGFFDAGLHLRFEAYLAITPNSFQTGAAVELGWSFGPFQIIGWIAFDALIEFHPFFFDVRFSAGVALRWRSTTLAGIKVSGSLSGPGPCVLTGRACIEILWFEICAEGQHQFGTDNQPAVAPVASAVQALRGELDDPANLRAVAGDDGLVVTADSHPELGEALVSPLGGLAWEQRRAPLDLLLERFEGVPLSAPQAVVATSPHARGTTDDWFAPDRYLNLSDSEALNKKTFDRLASGLVLGFDDQTSGTISRDVEVQTIRLPQRTASSLPSVGFPDVLLDGVADRSRGVSVAPAAATIGVQTEGWEVRAENGAVIASGRTEADAHQRAKHSDDGTVALPDGDLVDLGAW